MRRPEFEMAKTEALRLLESAEVMHLAGTNEDGLPVLKSLHGVVDGDLLCFHSSPKGEKTSLLGRPVVVSVEETVTRLPSYFSDPERACPATTLYRAVQAHGTLEPIEAPERKARILQGLMRKLQPEGGHVPIEADHPLYRPAVRGLLLAGLPLTDVTGKSKLGQNRTPEQRQKLLEQLWARGQPGDTRAIELMRAAAPDTPTPAFLTAPPGVRLHAWLEEEAADEAAGLLVGEYWNDLYDREDIRRAQAGSTAWVGARDEAGRLIASARALSDGGKLAWIYDVIVRPDWRGRGLGKIVVKLLLDHPAVRRTRRVLLGTRDAQSLYAGLGFVPRSDLPPRPYSNTEMVLVRDGARS